MFALRNIARGVNKDDYEKTPIKKSKSKTEGKGKNEAKSEGFETNRRSYALLHKNPRGDREV